MSGAKINYLAYEGEVLAIKYALEKFRHYVLGRKFTIIIDNKALQQVLTNEKQSKKIIRWIMALQEFDYEA